jgi:hypothetical protein
MRNKLSFSFVSCSFPEGPHQKTSWWPHSCACEGATDIAQIVISGTRRLTPQGVISTPAGILYPRPPSRGTCCGIRAG